MSVWARRKKDTESERLCKCYIARCSHFTPQRCPIETPPMDRMPIKYISFVFASFHWVNPKYLLDVSNKKSVHWKASQNVWHRGQRRSKPDFPLRVTPSVLCACKRINTERIPRQWNCFHFIMTLKCPERRSFHEEFFSFFPEESDQNEERKVTERNKTESRNNSNRTPVLSKHLPIKSNCLQMKFSVRVEGGDERRRGGNYLSSLGYSEVQRAGPFIAARDTHIHVLSLPVLNTLVLTHPFTCRHTLRQHSWWEG